MSTILEQLPVGVALTPTQERKAPAEELVMNSIREAVLYTRKCSYGKIPDDALLSLCYETMLKSAAIFKPGRIRFFAYCKARLRGEVKRYWRSLETVRNAETVSIDTLPTVGIRYSHKQLGPIETRTKEFRFEDKTHLHELEDETHPTTAELIGGSVEPEYDKMYLNDVWDRVSEAARRCCTDQERTILFLAYKLQLSFEEVGELLDISRQFASVTAKKALKKLRRILGNQATI
jgi:RNA polymerase sigma factor (sigma-70 family)